MKLGKYNIGKLGMMIATVAALSGVAHADEQVTTTSSAIESNRSAHKFGAYLSILGDPSPTLVGANVAYNLTDLVRLNAGMGRVSASIGDTNASLTTIGAGAKAMVPGWNVTPTAGFDVAYAIFSGSTSVGGLTESKINPYLSVGLDWQTQGGFNLGAAYNISLNGANSNPCLNVGYFF